MIRHCSILAAVAGATAAVEIEMHGRPTSRDLTKQAHRRWGAALGSSRRVLRLRPAMDRSGTRPLCYVSRRCWVGRASPAACGMDENAASDLEANLTHNRKLVVSTSWNFLPHIRALFTTVANSPRASSPGLCCSNDAKPGSYSTWNSGVGFSPLLARIGRTPQPYI